MMTGLNLVLYFLHQFFSLLITITALTVFCRSGFAPATRNNFLVAIGSSQSTVRSRQSTDNVSVVNVIACKSS